MDFLRRVLGLSHNSSQASNNVITITQGKGETVSPPPEPVIEPPPKDKKHKASGMDKQLATLDLSSDNTPAVSVEERVDPAGTRPLPPLEPFVPKPGQRISFGQLSDVGMVRGNNQDAVLSMLTSSTSSDDLPDFGLFIVADGMGGHHDGEKASAIAARIIAQHVLDEIFTPLLMRQMNDPDRPAIADVLRVAVQKANDAVTEQIPEGGTTVTATVILGNLAYIAHVGDSRAYMITDEGIEQITRDHTLVQRLIELDQLTPEEAAEHPQRNVLYRAIGQSETLDVDAITRRLAPHSYLVLCSDGLWNLVAEDTIRNIVHQYSDPQEACNDLVQLANDRGGSDNITVILVQIPG